MAPPKYCFGASVGFLVAANKYPTKIFLDFGKDRFILAHFFPPLLGQHLVLFQSGWLWSIFFFFFLASLKLPKTTKTLSLKWFQAQWMGEKLLLSFSDYGWHSQLAELLTKQPNMGDDLEELNPWSLLYCLQAVLPGSHLSLRNWFLLIQPHWEHCKSHNLLLS